jgi:hypothetical protein
MCILMEYKKDGDFTFLFYYSIFRGGEVRSDLSLNVPLRRCTAFARFASFSLAICVARLALCILNLEVTAYLTERLLIRLILEWTNITLKLDLHVMSKKPVSLLPPPFC